MRLTSNYHSLNSRQFFTKLIAYFWEFTDYANKLVQNSLEILFIDGVDPLDCCFLQWVLSVRLLWLCWSRLRLYCLLLLSSALLQQLQYSVSTLKPNCAASSTLHCLPCSWARRAESFCLACTGLAFPFLSSVFLLLWLASLGRLLRAQWL